MNLIAAVSATKPLPSGSIHEPDTAGNEPNQSTNSALECAPPKARSRRASSQSKTSYQLAHPPPTVKHRQRLRIRPRTLLQLQQLSSTSRPTPVIDVLPSLLFAPRLARRVPQIFQGKQGLGLNDLVLVHSQVQEPTTAIQDKFSQGNEETGSAEHEVIAAICQSKQGNNNGSVRTEIRFSHGSSWKAIALQSGAYEFVSHENGESHPIARWVPKREAKIERSPNTPESCNPSPERFRFSLMDTRSRRHPVIANMGRQSIDIYDRYSIPCTPRSPCQETDANSENSAGLEDHGKIETSERGDSRKTIIETDDHLRTIIAVTGIWVAFCEGWSPDFKYGTKQVISDGFSELSNRRRSNTVQSVSSASDEPFHQQRESRNGLRFRPGMIHMSSHSSVPSSPSLGSPMTSPRRTVSSSMTGCYDDDVRRKAPCERDVQPSPIVSDTGSEMEHDDPQSGVVTNPFSKGRSGVGVDDSERSFGRSEELPSGDRYVRKNSWRDTVSGATLVEEESRRPSRLRRIMGRFRRTRTRR
ncbi:MAG: hypothetical protein LQ338_002386 [Usnochroma carphineum]|nr:MAG: hypothetical protein LQ338_002386 [Usnochroma carphineum]